MEKKYMLKPEHPTMVRMYKLMKFANELGFSIEYSNYHCEVIDTLTGKRYEMEDLDSSEIITSFPSCFDFKLTYKQ